MFNKQIRINQNFLILILALFSLAVNQFYGNKGTFPIEGFAFFDTAYRVLQGEAPFKDYWAVSGIFIDYTQAIFFKIFGIHFQVYVFHASIVNSLLTLMTFFFAKSLKIKNHFSFFYALTFSLLAYTTSGTLYVDNHSSLLCLAAIYFFIFGILKEKKKYFFFIPILIGFAFFTKPAPTVYIFLLLLSLLFVYIILNKKYHIFNILLSSSLIFIIFIFIFFYFQSIPILLIFEQYFYFPITIANQRYENFALSLDNIFFNFKFIYIFLIPLILINIKNILLSTKYLFKKDFLIFLVILGFSLCLIFHQINTKNQLFILFLIPVLCIFLHSQLSKIESKNKDKFIIFFIIISIFLTYKYHVRFNENRKFHEMVNVNFNLAKNAKEIDSKLSGLKWISPTYSTSPDTEISLIKDTLKILKIDKSNKMVITNYSFFSTILEKKIHSPSRWFISNGAAYPIKANKYFSNYQNYLIDKIKNKKIDSIFIVEPVKSDEIFRYINSDCFNKKEMNKITSKYEIIPKCQLKNKE